MRRTILYGAILLAIPTLSFAATKPNIPEKPVPKYETSKPKEVVGLSLDNQIHAEGLIYKIVDGDTVIMSFHGEDFKKFLAIRTKKNQRNINSRYHSVKIRLASINTPESVHANKKLNTPEGKKASDYLKSWADKRTAVVDCYDEGRYGRMICNVRVKLKVGLVDIGLDMIQAGYTDYITDWGRNPYMDKAYTQAMEDRNNQQN